MKSRRRADNARLEMTPMIDVVFQLLIFFIVTLKQQDILACLDVARPATSDTPAVPFIETLTVQVGEDGWVLNGQPFRGESGFAMLDQRLARIASFSRHTGVMIKCSAGAPHSGLVRILNSCAREGMTNISVFSL